MEQGEKYVRVYPYYDAPEYFRNLITGHGGDEEWLIVCPVELRASAEAIADKLQVCDTISDEFELPGGTRVFMAVTAHS